MNAVERGSNPDSAPKSATPSVGVGWAVAGIIAFVCGLACYASALANMVTVFGAIIVETGHGFVLVAIFLVVLGTYLQVRNNARQAP